MSLMFLGVARASLTNRRQPISQPKVRSASHRFLSNMNPLNCSGRSTTCTIQRQTSITHIMNDAPSKPPSTQTVWRRHTRLPIRLTRLRTCLPPSRSLALAAVTNTRRTNPKVSTVINSLRPLICLPASYPTAWWIIAALFTLWLSTIASDGLSARC